MVLYIRRLDLAFREGSLICLRSSALASPPTAVSVGETVLRVSPLPTTPLFFFSLPFFFYFFFGGGLVHGDFLFHWVHFPDLQRPG